ncbi:DUF2486 family protein, partial [Burkholderia pseudomallei]
MVEANASSIPVLTDVLVPGNPALARRPPPGPRGRSARNEEARADPPAPFRMKVLVINDFARKGGAEEVYRTSV